MACPERTLAPSLPPPTETFVRTTAARTLKRQARFLVLERVGMQLVCRGKPLEQATGGVYDAVRSILPETNADPDQDRQSGAGPALSSSTAATCLIWGETCCGKAGEERTRSSGNGSGLATDHTGTHHHCRSLPEAGQRARCLAWLCLQGVSLVRHRSSARQNAATRCTSSPNTNISDR